MLSNSVCSWDTSRPKIASLPSLGAKTVVVLGGNRVLRTNVEVLHFTQNDTSSSICTQPADIPDKHSKGAIGTYFDQKIIMCGGWLAGRECQEYSLATYEWSISSYSLLNERAEAAGAMLENGSWIIIGGKGIDNSLPMSSTEIFDWKRSIFMPSLPWSEPVSGHCMEKINNSHIFIAGGEGSLGDELDSTYILNVDSSFWKPLDKRLGYKRSGHVCGIVSEKGLKYIIIAGGFELLDTEIIKISTMEFLKGPKLPFEMNWSATFHLNGALFLIGGEHIGYCSKPSQCFASDIILKLQDFVWKPHHKLTLKLPRSKHIIVSIPDEEWKFCQELCSNCKGISYCSADHFLNSIFQ